MNNALTLSDGRGGRNPNPKAFDLKWAEEQKLLEELDKLKQLSRTNGAEQQGQRELIRQLEADHAKARVAALRGGEPPDEGQLEEAHRKLELLRQQDQDLRRAVEMVRADLFKVVQANRETRLPEVEEQIAKEREELEALVLELNKKRHALESKAKLKEWLANPDLGFYTSPAPRGAAA
jgi:hypothetical protein